MGCHDQNSLPTSSDLVAEITDDCIGCGECMISCQFQAIGPNEKLTKAVVDWSKCTGCGVCEDVCQKGAIRLREGPSKGESLGIDGSM